VKFGFSPKPAREIVCDGLRKRGNDRLLRLQRGGTLGIDSHRRLLCRTRSRGTSHRREGLGSVSLVDRRRHCDGYRHLGNAFQGDACLPLASAGELLLADRSAVAAGRYFSLSVRAVCSEPTKTVAISAMHYTGMAAASFLPSAVPPNLAHAVSISPLGNNGIAIVTLLVLGAAILTSSMDRQTQAELQRLNEGLEQRVVERTRELTAVNEKLLGEIAERQRVQEALQETQAELAHITRVMAMGELVASIAHEVNQPLTAVVTNANFCLRQLASATPNLEKLREAIAEIVNDGTRASAVISRIRALLMKAAPERVELDINEIIQEVAILVRNEVTRNRISLRNDLAPDLPRVLGDRVQLQQVLINLVMNGIDAMRTLTYRSRELLIKSAKNPDGVLIQVQDSGPGLDPEQADRIFEPFFTTKPQGIGLGLSISSSIIESHGGRLWAVPGSNGALFQFTLPSSANSVS